MYAARRQLKSVTDVRIYINEHLTKAAANLFREARKLAKEKVYSSWMAGGVVYVRQSAEVSCILQRITSVLDLQKCYTINATN
jgi:hypothetical protein